ncbi:MAG: hypothetical protein AAF267_02170 [Deinococcota bacterium]
MTIVPASTYIDNMLFVPESTNILEGVLEPLLNIIQTGGIK